MGKRPFKLPNYPTYEGERGSPDQWREAFAERMGYAEAVEVIKSRSPRAILGVAVKCSWEDVKKAYRKRAMETHPDRGGSNEAFRDVNAAYSVLAKEYGQ